MTQMGMYNNRDDRARRERKCKHWLRKETQIEDRISIIKLIHFVLISSKSGKLK